MNSDLASTATLPPVRSPSNGKFVSFTEQDNDQTVVSFPLPSSSSSFSLSAHKAQIHSRLSVAPTTLLGRSFAQKIRSIHRVSHKLKPVQEEPPAVNTEVFKAKRHSKSQTVLRVPRPRKLEQLDIADKVFLDFLARLRKSNGLQLSDTGFQYYRYYIGPGNNSGLVKRALKKRWWWVATESRRQANLVWTASSQRKVLNRLPSASSQTFTIVNEYDSLIAPTYAKKSETEIKRLGYDQILKNPLFTYLQVSEPIDNIQALIYNRLAENKQLCTKKRLLKNLQAYCATTGKDVFSIVPLTFHISRIGQSESWGQFEIAFRKNAEAKENNIWIIKPGESSNRGNGIRLASTLAEVKAVATGSCVHSYVIQKYIEDPLLINNRKFDIRCFGLLTSINGVIQGYYYTEGYVRTSSVEYSLDSMSKYIHLTNDAIQKHADSYGKHESGNKLSYIDLQNYFDNQGYNVDFEKEVHPQMRAAMTDSFHAVHKTIDPARKNFCFELFGYDFMIDKNFKVWLIEANTNPCLEESCGLLSKILGDLLDNTFRIAVDPLFPPPPSRIKNLLGWVNDTGVQNKFQLIFSEGFV